MRLRPEHRSPRAWLLLSAVLACCPAPAARAQAPTCSWGSAGVVISGAERRTLLLAGDGGAGVVAVSVPVTGDDPVSPPHSSLRFHHILEQGRLDPNLPAEGATFFRTGTGNDPDPYPRSALYQVVSDGAGGAYALVQLCNPNLAHLRCYEVAVMRLFHVAADGAMYPGWPDGGVPLAGYYPSLGNKPTSIVPDGQGGVIVAWLAVLPTATTNSVLVQRYAPGGAALWSSTEQGVEVLAAAFQRLGMRVAGDRAGGAGVVVTTYTATAGRTDLLASRVLADGSLPWGTAGKVVIQQPTYAATLGDATFDSAGNLFITSSIAALSGAQQRLQCNQLLSPSAGRRFGITGTILFPSAPIASSAAFAGGYVCMYRDANGNVRFQSQDDVGSPQWGSGPEGMSADWSDPDLPFRPVTTAEDHVISVWESPFATPAPFVHAMELSEIGQPLPDWPAAGFDVCGYSSGHALADVLCERGNLFVAFGGTEFANNAPVVQRLSRAVLGVEPLLSSRALELAPPSPNPSRGAWNVRFALRASAHVTLDVFDVGGRRVLAEDLGTFAAGPHTASPERAATLAPGLYRVRVRAGAHTAQRTLVRVH